jgi:copper(I)-binding protein
MKHLITLLAATAMLLPLPSPSAEPGIVVHQPWIREAPPGATVIAAYLIIENPGNAPVTVSRITSPEFQRSELHRTRVEAGVARMEAVSAVQIPAGESVALLPGGMHLMLFEPVHPLREGDSATLVIHYGDGARTTVSAPVVRQVGDSAHHEHHH